MMLCSSQLANHPKTCKSKSYVGSHPLMYELLCICSVQLQQHLCKNIIIINSKLNTNNIFMHEYCICIQRIFYFTVAIIRALSFSDGLHELPHHNILV